MAKLPGAVRIGRTDRNLIDMNPQYIDFAKQLFVQMAQLLQLTGLSQITAW
jgi:hypothetical protein